MEVSITIDTSEVDRWLGSLERNLGITEAVIAKAIANEAFETIKRWCPGPTSEYYPTSSTGYLSSTHFMHELSPTSFKIFPVASYAYWVHEGHRMVPHGLAGVQIGKGHPKRGNVPWMPPRPWIREAVAYVTPHLKEIAFQALYDVVSSR